MILSAGIFATILATKVAFIQQEFINCQNIVQITVILHWHLLSLIENTGNASNFSNHYVSVHEAYLYLCKHFDAVVFAFINKGI